MYFRLKGYKIFKDRHGKMRCYHRASGEAIDLEKLPLGSVGFIAEATRINNLHAVMPVPKAGTLGMLIKEYKKSKDYLILRPKTIAFYEVGFEFLRGMNEAPLHKIDAPAVVKIRDRAHEKKSWYVANQVKTTLSVIFSWGVERGFMQINPAKQVKKIKRPKGKVRANRPWNEDECALVLSHAPAHVLPVLATMLYTGIDPCDAIALPKTKYKDGAIDLSRQKTGNPVFKPLPKVLKAIISAMPKHDAITLFANSYGKPWTKSGFDSVWMKLRKEIGLTTGLTLKGLRHTYATRLGEMGESSRTIADSLGDRSEAMGQWYSRDADTKNNMKRVVKIFDDHHSKTVKPGKKAVKP